MLTQAEVKKRFCVLAYETMCEVFQAQIPADCFCGAKATERGVLESLGVGFQFDERVLEYIEQAVRSDIEARREAAKEAQAIDKHENAWKIILPSMLALEFESVT